MRDNLDFQTTLGAHLAAAVVATHSDLTNPNSKVKPKMRLERYAIAVQLNGWIDENIAALTKQLDKKIEGVTQEI